MNRLASTVISVSLVVGIALTVWGLSQAAIPLEFPVQWDLLPGYWIFLMFCLPALALAGRLVPAGFSGAAVVLAALIGVAVGGLWPMLAVAWFTAAAILTGRAALSVLGIVEQQRSLVVEFLAGAGLYGTLVGLIAHFPVNYPGLYGAALTVPIAANWRGAIRLGEDFAHWLRTRRTRSRLEFLVAAMALLHFTVAFMPEVGHDALAMHLFVPAHLASRHEWGFDVSTYIWAVMPMLGDWIYSIGYILAGESAARLLNALFILIVVRLVCEFVAWAGGTVAGARLAALIFLTTPLTFTESSSLFIESVWTSYIVAGAFATMRAVSSESTPASQLKVAGALLGTALAAKAVTFTILPVLLFVLIWRFRSWVDWRSIPAILVGFSLFAVIGGIPYITAWSLTGNPVFPFFNQMFQSPFYPPTNFEAPSAFGKGLSWDVLYRATFDSGRYLEGKPGSAGFQWLLLFVPATVGLLLYRNLRGMTLVFLAATVVALVFMSVAYLRYVFPSFAVGAACIGIAWSHFMADNVSVRWLAYLAGFAAIALNILFFSEGTYYGDIEMAPMLSATGRSDYLQGRLPIRNAVEVVNGVNNGRLPVAVFAQPLVAGLTADALYPSWYNAEFYKAVKAAASADSLAGLLVRYGVEYIILDAAWGGADKRELVEQATAEIADLDTISVRRLRGDYRFKTELLLNPDFASAEGWAWPASGGRMDEGGIMVSVENPAYQVVPVTPGRLYLNTVTARCAGEPAQGRVQVNWLDAEQQFVKADIRVFDCSIEQAMHSMKVVSPSGAEYAVVYASGHTPASLILSEVSFRQ